MGVLKFIFSVGRFFVVLHKAALDTPVLTVVIIPLTVT